MKKRTWKRKNLHALRNERKDPRAHPQTQRKDPRQSWCEEYNLHQKRTGFVDLMTLSYINILKLIFKNIFYVKRFTF